MSDQWPAIQEVGEITVVAAYGGVTIDVPVTVANLGEQTVTARAVASLGDTDRHHVKARVSTGDSTTVTLRAGYYSDDTRWTPGDPASVTLQRLEPADDDPGHWEWVDVEDRDVTWPIAAAFLTSDARRNQPLVERVVVLERLLAEWIGDAYDAE